MSNHFRPPVAKPAPANERQNWELAGQTMLTVQSLCRENLAEASNVLAMAYLMQCRQIGMTAAHVHQILDVLFARLSDSPGVLL